jgi:hypothetical protein
MEKESEVNKGVNNTSFNRNSNKKVDMLLVENFVSLQKVLANLSEKFDLLTSRLNEMITLFEESAETVVRGEILSIEKDNQTKNILNKMERLFEQNKVIAKGLTLMNESIFGSNAEGSDSFDSSHSSFIPSSDTTLKMENLSERRNLENKEIKRDHSSVYNLREEENNHPRRELNREDFRRNKPLNKKPLSEFKAPSPEGFRDNNENRSKKVLNSVPFKEFEYD